MKIGFLGIILFLGWLPLQAQVQFSVVCNQQNNQLEVVVSGREQTFQKVLKDRFPNQAAAEKYLRDNAATLSCGPRKSSTASPAGNTQPSVTTSPPATVNNSPGRNTTQPGVRLPELKTKSSYLGIITYQPEPLNAFKRTSISESMIPTLYYSGGRHVAKQFALNFEMLFNYKKFDIDYLQGSSNIRTLTNSYSLAGGLQGHYRVKLPIDVVSPFGQASVGYMHSFLTNELSNGGSDLSYDHNFGLFYWKVGAGALLMISDGFGFYIEGDYFWTRSVKTLGQITEDILTEQGVSDPRSIVPDYSPFTDVVSGQNFCFSVGMVFRSLFR